MKKIDLHQFKGMVRDVSIESQKPEFLWDAHNIRLTAREGDTLLSLTNERGTKQIEIEDGFNIEGVYVGHCVIGKYLTIFTEDLNTMKDYIYRIQKMDDGTFAGKSLTPTGLKLNFDYKHPLQTLGVYENISIQKVYWTDGINQPRVINITKDIQTGNADIESTYLDTSFDFVRELSLDDSIHIKKKADSSGLFGAGVIQYAITYFDKYGQESNISCISPLIATSFTARAGSPEERIGNAFEITIKNPDTTFEYVRIYSIFRSSKDATPHCKKVVDIHLGAGGKSDVPTLEMANSSSSKNVNISYWGNCWIYEDYLNNPTSKISLNDKKYANNYTIQTGSSTYAFQFKKSDFPNLVIYDNQNQIYITWGSATAMTIQKSSSVHVDNKYYIEGSAALLTGSSILLESAKSKGVVYVDNNSEGEDIEPQTLLYIGGEEVTAETITSKDGTLFMGNIEVKRPYLQDYADFINTNTTISSSSRKLYVENVFKGNETTGANYTYTWGSTLNGLDSSEYSTNGSCFKYSEHYRLGVQFQYKTGKWSDPIPLKGDGGYSYIEETQPSITYNNSKSEYKLPIFKGTLSNADQLINLGYKKVRGVVCFPAAGDRLITAQGVLNPTVYNVAWRALNTPYCQSSWFFRPFPNTADVYSTYSNDNYVYEGANIQTEHNKTLYGYGNRGAEIQGLFRKCHNKNVNDLLPLTLGELYGGGESDNKVVKLTEKKQLTNVFAVDQQYVTMHSPDFEFDDAMASIDFSLLKQRLVGYTEFASNVGDIDIKLDTSVIGTQSTGFYKQKLYTTTYKRASRRLCAGLFFRDWVVDDWDDKNSDGYHVLHYYDKQTIEIPYMVYPWQKTGSLNNDIARGTNAGTRTAQLKEKIISNIKFSFKNVYGINSSIEATSKELFNQDFIESIKLGQNSYYGNVDSLVTSPVAYSTIFATGEKAIHSLLDAEVNIPFDTSSKYFLSFYAIPEYAKEYVLSDSNGNTIKYPGGLINFYGDEYTNDKFQSETHVSEGDIGDQSGCIGLRQAKDAIRMAYKSTPHVIIKLNTALQRSSNDPQSYLYMAELYKDASDTDFGGTTDEALEQNKWYTAGEAVTLDSTGDTTFYYNYGDTWFQRYDCLKTYPYTDEGTNQIVEIGSFMCETHVNIDGRYDKNRGLDSNLYIRPTNFNLINPVYSQLDNFFTYRILDQDYYKLTQFKTAISWTKQKSNASDVDAWTNVSLASVLDLDGCYGEISSLNCSNDTLYCFQSDAVSNILFNSRVQISPSDGVPIEVSNNYKVDGYKYITLTAGTNNKRAIVNGYGGLYFVDRLGDVLYLLQGNQLKNISGTNGFGFWMSEQDTNSAWIPALVKDETAYTQQGLALYYDNQYNDIYLVTDSTALCYSEEMQAFISFFNYENVPAMFNLDQDFYSLYFTSKAIAYGTKTITVINKTESGDTISTTTVTLKVSNSLILTTNTSYKGETYLQIANKSSLNYDEVEDGKTYIYYFKKKSSESIEEGTKTITITYYDKDTNKDLQTTSYSCTKEQGKFLLPDKITVDSITFDVEQDGYIYYEDINDGDTYRLGCDEITSYQIYISFILDSKTVQEYTLQLQKNEEQTFYKDSYIPNSTTYKIEETTTITWQQSSATIQVYKVSTNFTNTVTFDFTNPTSLNPSITPGESVGNLVTVLNKNFTAQNQGNSISLKFEKSGTPIVAIQTTSNTNGELNYLLRAFQCSLIFTGDDNTKIKSIQFTGQYLDNLSLSNSYSDKYSSQSNYTWESISSSGETSIEFNVTDTVYIKTITVTYITNDINNSSIDYDSTDFTTSGFSWYTYMGNQKITDDYTISASDLNNYIVGVDASSLWTSLVTSNREVQLVDQNDITAVIATGTFSTYTSEELDSNMLYLKLNLNKTVTYADVKNYDQVSFVVWQATWGDQNFEKYLKDSTSTTASECKVNPKYTLTFSIKNEDTTSSTTLMAYSTAIVNQTLTLWKMFAGDYNKFFGKQYQSDFTLISNLEPTTDKIFTNLEIRADFYNLTPVGDAFNKEKLNHQQFFDTLQVWNEYQDTGEQELKFEKTIPSILKKKFRVWRAIIPRDNQYTRDRIRNTWTKVKLAMNKSSNYGMELHDIGVVYYN